MSLKTKLLRLFAYLSSALTIVVGAAALLHLGFFRPAFFWFFLPLPLIPILVHFLTRPKPREVHFSGTHFLAHYETSQRRRLHAEDLELMVIRICALILLFLAAIGLKGMSSQTSTLKGILYPHFLVDGSGSMWIPRGGRNALEKAAQTIEELIREQRWDRYEVWICKGERAVRIWESSGRSLESIAAILKDWGFFGFSDLPRCAQQLAQNSDRDLIIVSDENPLSMVELPGAFRSLSWLGVGGESANIGIGPLSVEIQGSEVMVSGTILGRGISPRSLRLHWLNEIRPDLVVPVTSAHFNLRTLLPSRSPRAVLTLEPLDEAPWDNRIPLLFPQNQRPRVVLAGMRTRDEERYIWELLMASSPLFSLLQLDRPFDPDEIGVGILFAPWNLPELQSVPFLRALERGSRMIVFSGPVESQELRPSPWIPGWLHPAQPVPDGALYPTPHFLAENPELRDLPWNVAEIKQLYPLGDPDPSVRVLLMSRAGLPILVSFPYGQGIVYLWLLEPQLGFTNIHLTALWVPLWLKLSGVSGKDHELLQVPLPPESPILAIPSGQRTIRPLDSLGTEAWTGWLTLKGKSEVTTFSVRVSEREILPGTFSDFRTLKAPPQGEDSRPINKQGKDLTPILMGLFLLLWLVQGVLSVF